MTFQEMNTDSPDRECIRSLRPRGCRCFQRTVYNCCSVHLERVCESENVRVYVVRSRVPEKVPPGQGVHEACARTAPLMITSLIKTDRAISLL